MAKAKEVPKSKPAEESKIMEKLIMTLAIAEQKRDLQIEKLSNSLEEKISAVDKAGKSFQKEIEALKCDKRIESAEGSINVLRKDLNAHQNKMKGVDELKPVCNQHESMILKMHDEIVLIRKELERIPVLEAALSAAKKEISELKVSTPKIEERLSVTIKSLKERLNQKEEHDKEKVRCLNNKIDDSFKLSEHEMKELASAHLHMKEKLDGLTKLVGSIHTDVGNRINELILGQREKQDELRAEMQAVSAKFRDDKESIVDKLDAISFVGKRCEIVESRVEKIFYDLKEVRVHLNI